MKVISNTSGEFILLLDDKTGKNAAKKLGLATTGLVGGKWIKSCISS